MHSLRLNYFLCSIGYMREENIVDLELSVVFWESTAAVQIHTFVR